jgi:hypothetical protein
MEPAEVRLPNRKKCFGGGGVLIITMPYHVSRYVSVSGVWIRVRKPEGEGDVGREWDRGILSSRCGTGRVRDVR